MEDRDKDVERDKKKGRGKWEKVSRDDDQR